MTCCPDRQDVLLLDVYGELRPQERSGWERHLTLCADCRKERKRLLGLLQDIRVAGAAPRLSKEKSFEMLGDITRALEVEREQHWWRKLLGDPSRRLIPALAAASVILILLGWIGFHQLDPQSMRTAANTVVEEPLKPEEVDILKNLDMLEEMDALEKLVRLVDNRKYGTVSPKGSSRSHRKGGHEGIFS